MVSGAGVVRGEGVGVEWWCAGGGWIDGRAVLRWRGGRVSSLAYGKPLAFRVVGERRCVGARGNPCPHGGAPGDGGPRGAVVAGRASQARCPECARLDRAFSVAADGVPDDPRTYRVYLAWFGPGLVKVGITAEERGAVRLLEQGAVAYGWLGRGPLMAARRTEELLRAALGVPDRVPYEKKRVARGALPPWPERAAELAALHGRAVALDGWAETLEPLEFAAVDHSEPFGLERVREAGVRGVVEQLVDGGVVAGRVVAAAGPDLHLGSLVVDTRLLVGWQLVADGGEGGTTVPVREPRGEREAPGAQEGLF
ncbi:DUF2797 domain-containing protein [Streptomyces sp. NPDC050504]|uniref:DUF2797 domain-containing protein n=1 Tax=Streptomyces sp. NPDC050504 TaxID=3365618 RepID=UPI0037B15E04